MGFCGGRPSFEKESLPPHPPLRKLLFGGKVSIRGESRLWRRDSLLETVGFFWEKFSFSLARFLFLVNGGLV